MSVVSLVGAVVARRRQSGRVSSARSSVPRVGVRDETLEQLSGTGGDLFLANAHRIFVTGPSKVRAAGPHDRAVETFERG